ncbi:MAG TPA: GNAT family N-acyltransferase, partial [Pseudomonadales bacterium]|nr:GNAT family N-acyltransferase [Pseudomonadales bacterium]
MLQDLVRNHPETSSPTARIYAEILTRTEDIRQAQRLRYETFCEEYAVTLPIKAYWRNQPIDIDEFDEHCIHLAVRESYS